MSTLEDRKKLWKMHNARADFTMVADTCAHILKANMDYHDNVYYALIVGVYTIYSRPFTRSNGAGKLSERIVPTTHMPLHKRILEHRHQIYAHSDPSSQAIPFCSVNHVRFFADRGGILPGVPRWREEQETLQQIIELCQVLIKKAKYWCDRMQDKHFPGLHLSSGEYVVNLDPASSDFLVKVPTLRDGGIAVKGFKPKKL